MAAVEEPSPQKPQVTYRDLRLAGYTGTKYDAEMLISQGIENNYPELYQSVEAARKKSAAAATAAASEPQQQQPQRPAAFAPAGMLEPAASRKPLTTTKSLPVAAAPSRGRGRRRRGAGAASAAAAAAAAAVNLDLNVTTKSLRNTPGRLRARCERGRAASDSSSSSSSSSSGISDDASSSSSGSDRDSGIETSGGEYEGCSSGRSGRPARAAVESRLEAGVQRMNLGAASSDAETSGKSSSLFKRASPLKRAFESPRKLDQQQTSPGGGGVKLTLRVKKRHSPVLDDVIAKGHSIHSSEPSATSAPPLNDDDAQRDQHLHNQQQLAAGVKRQRRVGPAEYEVLRMEGVTADPEVSFNNSGIKRALASSPLGARRKHKRRKLVSASTSVAAEGDMTDDEAEEEEEEDDADAMSPPAAADHGMLSPPPKTVRLLLGNETMSTIQLQN